MQRSVYLCLGLGVVLAAAACDIQVGDRGVSVGVSGGKATDQWQRTYTLEPGARLEIINTFGSIDVSGADGSDLYVQVNREAHASSDEAARASLESLKIVEDTGKGGVKVETRGDQSGSGGFRHRVTARYIVRVPSGLTASFRTENGSLSFENVNGRITAATTNGTINGTGLSGAVSASTVNGAVQLALTSVSDPMELTAVNGGIRLELSKDVKADVVATAVNGGVSVDDQLNLSADEGSSSRGFPLSRRVTGRLNGGGPKISAQTTNGGVRIMAPGSGPGFARGRRSG
jgi:Toastrack DUF4097